MWGFANKTYLAIHGCEIDLAASRIKGLKGWIQLKPKSMDVLEYLLDRPLKVCTREEILNAVWGRSIVSDDVLSQAISELRKAFNDDFHSPSVLETIPRRGYRLLLEPITRKTSYRVWHWPVIFAMAVIAIFLVYLYTTRPQALARQTIAVLPFVNMSDDAANEYFSDGISEELLNLLAKIPELRVIARSSAFYFKGKDVKLADVARELNVTHILEGSVRKAGNHVRITAQLIEASSDTHLWSESYDRTLDDIFVIQDEIAGSVVDALKLTLFGDAPRTEPIDPEAYALYLQAVHVGDQYTAETLEQSNVMLKQVLDMAPNYARAWRVLARNYRAQAAEGLLPREEGNALAREALNQALAFDPELAEAHCVLGMFAAEDNDLVAAAQHIRHALSLEPNNPIVLGYSAFFLRTLGRLDEAIAIGEYRVAHDPLDLISHNNLAWRYYFAGRPDDAIATARVRSMLSPGYVWHGLLGLALLSKGENEAALKAIQQEPDEFLRLSSLVMVYHALGQVVESDAALTELIGKHEQHIPYAIAAVLAYRGEADRAFAWLDKAVAYGDPDLSSIAMGNMFSNLYEDPRWLPFLERIGSSPAQLAAIEFEVKLPE
jgi:TolB-like protein/DNA-binding winged helix-turn-helix (wHTH) protein